jgi:hypothetical protein
MSKCEHDREKSVCKECGGGSICEHQIVRSTCSICSPDSVFQMYKYKAEKRGLRFELTLAQFKYIVQRSCVFCGEYGYGRGIDRKDNSKGYVFENCQACCGFCNFMKRAESQERFLHQVLKIARHQQKLKEPVALAQ